MAMIPQVLLIDILKHHKGELRLKLFEVDNLSKGHTMDMRYEPETTDFVFTVTRKEET